MKQNYCLSKDTYDHCDKAGLLRPKRYTHRSSGRNYVSSSSLSIPVLNFRQRIRRLSHSGADFTNLSFLLNSCAAVSAGSLNAPLLNALYVNNEALLLSDFKFLFPISSLSCLLCYLVVLLFACSLVCFPPSFFFFK